MYPLASVVVKRDFYVDDLLTGANNLAEAEILRDQLIGLLGRGGFNLRKWTSNHMSLVDDRAMNPETTHRLLDREHTLKTLGSYWNSRDDNLFYSENLTLSKSFSKRSILSQISKLFDPLGLLGPVIVYAKIIIQLCWKSGVTWDESVPQDIYDMWFSYQSQLHLLRRFRISRCLLCPEASTLELHEFCDASVKAYGACLYLRSRSSSGVVHV